MNRRQKGHKRLSKRNPMAHALEGMKPTRIESKKSHNKKKERQERSKWRDWN